MNVSESARQEGGARPSLFMNALSNWVVFAGNLAVAFFVTPYIIHHIGKDNYGFLTLVASVVGYYGLLDVGVQSAVARYIAKYAGERDNQRMSETISTALAMLIAPAVTGAAASFVLAGWLASFFRIEPASVQQFRHLMWLFGAGFAVSLLGGVFRVTMMGYERYVLINAINIGQTVLRTVGTIVVLSTGGGLIGIIAANLTVEIAAIAAIATAVFRTNPELRVSLRLVSRTTAWALITFGLSSSLIVVADILRFRFPSLIIGRWVNIGAVAVYGLAASIVSYAATVVDSAASVLLPRFSKLQDDESRDACGTLLLRSMSYAAVLSFGAFVSATVCGRAFVERWVGPDYRQVYLLVMVLMSGHALSLAQMPGFQYLRAANKHHFFAVISVIEGLANFAASVALVTRYGNLGVAIGLAAPRIIVKVLVQPVYTARVAGMPVTRYWKSIGGPMLVALPLLALAWRFQLPLTASWPAIVATGMGAFAVFVGLAMFLVMSRSERQWALGNVSALMRLKLAAFRP